MFVARPSGPGPGGDLLINPGKDVTMSEPSPITGEGAQTSMNRTNTENSRTFSAALRQKHVTPKEEQAIILLRVQGIKFADYIKALAILINPKDITHASPISHNRICVYFSSKDIVENFIIDHGGLTVNDVYIQARRLTSPAKRIIISNVAANIPFVAIENHLRNLNYKIVSPITSLSCGLREAGLEHIQSFRCQVYIVLEETDYLPDSLLIESEGKSRRIYLSRGEVKCFRCNLVGHIAVNCRETIEETQETTTPTNETSTEPGKITHKEKQQEKNKDTTQGEKEKTPIPSMSTEQTQIDTDRETAKRSRNASSISDEESSNEWSDEKNENQEFKAPKPLRKLKKDKRKRVKKLKKDSPDPNEAFLPIENFFKEQERSTQLSFEEIIAYLKECKGSERPLEIAQEFTENIPELKSTLIKLVPRITYNPLKERIKRLIKQLNKSLGEPSSSQGDLSEKSNS